MRCSIFALILLIAAPAFSQHDSRSAPSDLIGHFVPREIIERPVPLRSGVGTITHKTSTTSSEAQAYYEQGLAYLHSYVWIEAARSFNQALRIDPSLALAWVGLSRAYSGLEDPKAAGEAQARATALEEKVTDRERRWIRARALQLDAMSDLENPAKRLAYVVALDQALEDDADDAELWTLRGNVEEVHLGAAGRGQRGTSSSIVFYEEAIRRVPGHFPAHHYLIHSYENVGRFDQALKHGEIYAAAAPQVPHALHMYGHDLMKLGRMQEAIDIFLRARRLEHDYYAGDKIQRDFDWHHAHNTALLALSYRHVGQLDETERMLRDAASIKQASPVRAGYYRGLLTSLLIARGRNGEALSEAIAMTGSSTKMVNIVGHALAGRALMAMGRMDDAKTHLAPLIAADAEGDGFMYGSYAGLEVDVAKGEWLLRNGEAAKGEALLRDAMARARRQRTPDGWIEGLFFLESIFTVARAADDWDLARDAAAKLAEHDATYRGTKAAQAALESGSKEGSRKMLRN
jgi:tetratricopeptide (TPR) repeat protein